ncbi:SusC/RagA family TonB-linked outer membrane protein [Leeuwenhoekiella parthenopeia]|uniref:SusC/RagA family TonB-linked outer membrane protein n=1 Tax=Leeuwenhoekiella parthenopeia TaxID=2890320 RepID=A0ABS8GNL1_9FLAO|nr:SusC/RagA family TonB-linked outer membrane protein [Leeuwenhoekiella parthenopeia]MCC4211270.1 SusC/RagA family TonB-linked outer membrane protein [Leeuwenhoekiella parthenopeia]
MNKVFKNILFVLFTFCLSFSMNAQNRAEGSTISGTVKNQIGEPIENVRISSLNGKRTYTDANGKFQFKMVEPEMIRIDKEAFATQYVELQADSLQNINIVLVNNESRLGSEDRIQLPFGSLPEGKLVGSVVEVDVQQDHLEQDQRIGVGSAINGKVGGVRNGNNILGIGSAIYVVDGIPRPIEFINLTEVEKITVLKDPVSKVLYGAAADQGVILITTRRGEAFQNKIRVRYDNQFIVPRALPDYLGAADYMTAFNQARINDGASTTYSQDMIDATRSGVDPVRYPDNDLYGNRFVSRLINSFDVNLEASGGNEKVQYFLNLGANQSEGWIAYGKGDQSTRLNLRANTDYKLSDRLKANLDAIVVLDYFKTPDVFDVNNEGVIQSDFWTILQNTRPNDYPLLIPIDRVDNIDNLSNASLIDGQFLLGGNANFQRNLIGDLTNRGIKNINDRYLQFNTGLDWDLSFITKGLTASGKLTFDFFNRSVENQSSQYAVYQPQFLENQAGQDSLAVSIIGVDQPINQRNVSSSEAAFNRQLGFYGTLNYERSFADHAIDITALAYRTQQTLPGTTQDLKRLTFGLRANYMLAEKYIVEFSGAYIGSQKLAPGNRYGFSPTGGLGWLISNEDWFEKSDIFNYLKLRGTAGLTLNDSFDGNFLYQTSFSRAGFFNYNNTTGFNATRNQILLYDQVGSPIDFQKRFDVNFGFDAELFNNTVTLRASYFRSRSYDLVTQLNSSTPALTGYIITANNNSFVDKGLEYQLNIKNDIGEDFKMEIGFTGIYNKSVVEKFEEPIYSDDSQYRVATGQPSGSIFSYVADGLLGPDDFNPDGTLRSELPQPTFGSVQPGDIKYIDLNGDGVIDVDDQRIIGSNRPDMQYGVSLNLNYKNWQFYVLGVGQFGQDQFRNGSYFRFSGQDKYSVYALDAYGPGNTDVNATIPRLSSGNNSNNNRNSSFWLYENNFFNIPAIQLGYNFRTNETSGIKDLKIYLRGIDVVSFNKNKEFTNLNFGVGSSPQTSGFALGLNTTF